ncbi:MAG: hypothetical protein LQ342_000458 [Letrouitia transgressa]|nr:MAG: hypothetical protein LQ342_000458 [Letrouitia transgressa]
MKENLALPEAKYLTGWSHGKEALKTGQYDTLKGSFYVNCGFYQDSGNRGRAGESNSTAPDGPELTTTNVWPPESTLPGFRKTFEELCNLIIDVAVLVARACDEFAASRIEGYEQGYLERVVRTSNTTKARLLHYFPPAYGHLDSLSDAQRIDGSTEDEEAVDTWCATHVDHGCLTGLTSALYIDERAHPPRSLNTPGPLNHPPTLPALPGAPDPHSGLYIRSRMDAITKVSIPHDCLGFQTGEALQMITGGKFRAVPHFVQLGKHTKGSQVARNTLAVFTQPNFNEIVDKTTGKTFAQFSKEVAERFH